MRPAAAFVSFKLTNDTAYPFYFSTVSTNSGEYEIFNTTWVNAHSYASLTGDGPVGGIEVTNSSLMRLVFGNLSATNYVSILLTNSVWWSPPVQRSTANPALKAATQYWTNHNVIIASSCGDIDVSNGVFVLNSSEPLTIFTNTKNASAIGRVTSVNTNAWQILSPASGYAYTNNVGSGVTADWLNVNGGLPVPTTSWQVVTYTNFLSLPPKFPANNFNWNTAAPGIPTNLP